MRIWDTVSMMCIYIPYYIMFGSQRNFKLGFDILLSGIHGMRLNKVNGQDVLVESSILDSEIILLHGYHHGHIRVNQLQALCFYDPTSPVDHGVSPLMT